MNCPVTNNSPKENFSIGILFAPIISFRLNGIYRNNEQIFSGEYSISKEGNNLILYSSSGSQIIPNNFTFIPEDYDSSDFDLLNVIIGINFHWQRTENQKFKGTLKIIDEEKHLTAVNLLPLEDYLLSVISSEMSATSSLELLKAHAVISRSWLIAQKLKNKTLTTDYQSCIQDKHRYIRWYDREDHANFDVCADDHCQRYQGCSKAYTPAVRQAIEATRGEVLTYEGKICDARFSKCCGGVSERFDNTWEPVNHPYLTKIIDSDTLTTVPNLSQEEEAKKWILSSPDVFCNTQDKEILSNVLNDYDQETRDFFRWQVSYTPTELSALVLSRIGIDFGLIQSIEPLQRGVSGRIIQLRINGTKKSMVIGKELVIRKAFSKSHLYSSAFIVETEKDTSGIPIRFTFKGAGWGHGVGLCQIGAAVMSAKGYGYQEILSHYFPGTKLETIEN
ncbi:SpoIID/LytB domain-containing protein [Odoribacter sp. AF15-53]|uniref:SpoIID/LytB domain-containing protein n=1 Tax=Odoribacter sp. AF15-53 TaxID=2292236 RepID=UPI000E4CD1ED|nr:SpoIID/LytB domain-containing protein [Odoribacter sp. AF15-53]RHR80656.1 SpoIID/LytB domain-containing protein [Odoribacter sp. AF15-53]